MVGDFERVAEVLVVIEKPHLRMDWRVGWVVARRGLIVVTLLAQMDSMVGTVVVGRDSRVETLFVRMG